MRRCYAPVFLLMAAGCTAEDARRSADGDAAANVPTPIASETEAPETTAGSAAHPAPVPDTRQSPCLVQDGQPVRVAPVRAVGTEPFWGARTQGRCVTYSTPEDQAGTRVWARVESGPKGVVWNGALRGKRFQLTVRPMPGCSDGMSDTRYPLEAELLVDGEERRGCAEPSSTGR